MYRSYIDQSLNNRELEIRHLRHSSTSIHLITIENTTQTERFTTVRRKENNRRWFDVHVNLVRVYISIVANFHTIKYRNTLVGDAIAFDRAFAIDLESIWQKPSWSDLIEIAPWDRVQFRTRKRFSCPDLIEMLRWLTVRWLSPRFQEMQAHCARQFYSYCH